MDNDCKMKNIELGETQCFCIFVDDENGVLIQNEHLRIYIFKKDIFYFITFAYY